MWKLCKEHLSAAVSPESKAAIIFAQDQDKFFIGFFLLLLSTPTFYSYFLLRCPLYAFLLFPIRLLKALSVSFPACRQAAPQWIGVGEQVLGNFLKFSTAFN
jgi:hypothetical protein